MPVSLSKIGKMINLEKLEIDHSIITKQMILKDDNFKKNIIEYCIRDNKIVISFINIILKNIDINLLNNSLSISSLSLNTFKKHFNTKKINTSITIENDMLIRKAYYGGRCEVFGNPKKNELIYHFDFNSMYPQMMKEKFCYGDIQIKQNITNTNEPGFYNITIKSNIDDIPILPYKSNKNDKLLFPNGS
jgi:hypothetical protein